jgi:hypothetical protein
MALPRLNNWGFESCTTFCYFTDITFTLALFGNIGDGAR